jgi:DNA-binding transcriptional ArsR family regulator
MTIKRDPNRMEVPVHPGEVLLEEFLRPLGLSQATLARHLNVSLVRVNELALARRGEDPAGELMRVVADRKVRPPLRTGRHDVGFRASVGVPPCSEAGKMSASRATSLGARF